MLKKPLFQLAVTTFFTLSAVSMAQAGSITGTVLETMNSGGYTYILVDSTTAKQWVAIPETTIDTGARVTYLEGMKMQNFHSKSLDRTFPTIIFSEGLSDKPAKAAPQQAAASKDNSFAAAVAQEQQTASLPQQQPMLEQSTAGSAGAIVPFTDLTVDKASGDNSYTVEEIFSKAKDLNGKKVRIRGQVVKFSPNIMGKNWIHIQDGTGNPMKNSHDLVVTSADTVEDGNIIIVSGILAADKDFGAGYKYEVIVENAAVER
ncbi:DNA-binding protein [Desulfopila sp. IMCC35008]|uniref:DNA-binding protein n=1 Tax=Desulfopila sp. IMCC35008 TaxID=2653858 RepID=UPI0013D2C32B|nr:DNA-binding protein [Desulfopila sp. IMCC35008]